MAEKLKTKWDGKPVEREAWGRDHQTTLLYIETRCVDYGGKLDTNHLRKDGQRYPSQLRMVQLVGHNDYDCIADFEFFGLCLNRGTGLHPVIELTPLGWTEAHKLRRERAERAIDARKSGAARG